MAKSKHKLELVNSSAEDHKAFAGKNFTQHHLVSFQAKTTPQQQFMDSFFAQVPVTIQVGSAGTGKTAVALYCALTEVFDKSTVFDRIIIVRSAVQARDIGFLKGTEEEKDSAYEKPYVSLCDELLTFKSNNYENLKAKNLVEFRNTSFLRGQTFDDAILLVDEMENMNFGELATIITRVGINSKVVFMGDYKQCDLHKKNDKSGYHEFLKICQEMPSEMVDVIHYTPHDIIRSGICKEFLLAEERISEEENK